MERARSTVAVTRLPLESSALDTHLSLCVDPNRNRKNDAIKRTFDLDVG